MDRIERIISDVGNIIIGKRESITRVLVGVLCGGHLLIEDVPGVGKTTLVKAFARVLGCSFQRIQFTPDLMPSDILGVSVYRKEKEQFVFTPGPIMNQVILADEINRTSPKTQASLLEAMAEKQITVDGVTYKLPEPFIVMATQNPIEYEGTFPLPEAQLDRFMMRISLGYPRPEEEKKVLHVPLEAGYLDELEPVINAGELCGMQQQVKDVFTAPTLESYLVDLAWGTRKHPDILLGVSPRGSQHLHRAAKGAAYVQGRDYVLPDDIKSMAGPVFSHTLLLKPEARLKGSKIEDVLSDILNKTHVPVAPYDKG